MAVRVERHAGPYATMSAVELKFPAGDTYNFDLIVDQGTDDSITLEVNNNLSAAVRSKIHTLLLISR